MGLFIPGDFRGLYFLSHGFASSPVGLRPQATRLRPVPRFRSVPPQRFLNVSLEPVYWTGSVRGSPLLLGLSMHAASPGLPLQWFPLSVEDL